MEYCDIGSIFTYLREQINLDLLSRAEVLQQSARAVSFMHGQNPPIVHPDIKLGNILLKSEEKDVVAKKAEFGLSNRCDDRQLDSDSLFSHADFMTSVVGTPDCQAPEVIGVLEVQGPYGPSVHAISL